MIKSGKLVITYEKIKNSQLFLLALFQIIPLTNISNSSIEQVTLVMTLVVLLSMLVRNVRVIGNRYNLIIIALNFMSVFITVSMHGGSGSAIMVINLMLSALIFNNIEITHKIYRRLHFFLAFMLTVYLVRVDISKIYSTVVWDAFGNSFNSNMFALLILAGYLHWVCFIFASNMRRWEKNTCFIIISVISMFYIWISGSRTSIIAILLFWLLYFLGPKEMSNRRFRVVTIVVLILSLIFPILYVAFAKKYSDIVIMNKSLFSGRQIVWQSTFDIIKQYPFFGNANEILLSNVQGHMTASTHNMMLGYMKMFGIIPTVTVIGVLVNNNANRTLGRRKRVPQIVFLSTLVCAFFESFYTNSQLYMLFAFFLLAFVNDEDKTRTIL